MNSHGVEILLTRCVEKMVHGPNRMPFIFYFYQLRFVSSSRYKRCMECKAMA